MSQVHQKGMSLLELMVVVLIVGVLASVAFTGYQKQVQSSRRADAIEALMDAATTLERRFTETNSYTGATLATTSRQGFYTLSSTITAASYTVTATATGVQAKDSNCATMSLNQSGSRTATSSECWK